MFWAWAGSDCESPALGWPPTPAWLPETTHAHLQSPSLCFELVSPTHSECVCLGLSLGTWKARGRLGHCCWQRTVWRGMPHGVWLRCVEVQCHTTFDAWNKTAKKYAYLFLNSINCIEMCVFYCWSTSKLIETLCPEKYVFAVNNPTSVSSVLMHVNFWQNDDCSCLDSADWLFYFMWVMWGVQFRCCR